MTNKQAFRALMAPYILPELTIEFLLTQQGLVANEVYNKDTNQTALYNAVIDGLYQVKTLTKEKDPGSENTYDVSKINDLINRYRRKIGLEDLEEEEVYFIDRTDEF